ncbi:MAG: hypothetical protein DLM59_05905 [Pseudonocardiales bacterium]|nr:MAG: hypothetical protein DLM59_05905 [Pseudonocardiales bacterium]
MSVLHLDVQIRSGWEKDLFGVEPPYVPGSGYAGRAVAVGADLGADWVGRAVGVDRDRGVRPERAGGRFSAANGTIRSEAIRVARAASGQRIRPVPLEVSALVIGVTHELRWASTRLRTADFRPLRR